MAEQTYLDWGEVSEKFDTIKQQALNKSLNNESEAQTRFDIIDRIIREVLQWKHGQISVEEYSKGVKEGYVDYILKSGDNKIIMEAKKHGASFPSPSRRKKLKLTGSILNEGEIGSAIRQAEEYAKTKDANIVIVTNGSCWCFYPLDESVERDVVYAYLLFPFEDIKDAEGLFNFFAVHNVEQDSLAKLNYENPYITVKSLINAAKNADARIGRNNIADFISPALDYAFHGESLIGDEDKLDYCFVNTDARTKYDNTLRIFLADKKPQLQVPAKRIRKQREHDDLQETLKILNTNRNVPITLLIGAVGAGKSTYLSHFELIHAAELLRQRKCFWVNIDFEKMGATGNPRKFIYETLRDFALNEHPNINTDFQHLVQPAYEEEIKKLARGPFGLAAKNKELFDQKIQELIEADFTNVEPYVEKIYSYISKTFLCVIVLDNIDLYEDTKLEIEVFSEGIALSKKLNCNILMSIRDTTFVKHKNESIFNAHELKRFWLDPPPFREVLSKRLKFAGLSIKKKKANIQYAGATLKIEDLGVFFDIAHSTLLQEKPARFIESISDGNIRKGISMVANFLTSAHIQADRAIYNYLNNSIIKALPFHEVFKGSVLGPWKFYKEERAEIINILNSGLYSKSLLFLRAYVLKYLFFRAKDKTTLETSVRRIAEVFSPLGASEGHIVKVTSDLYANKLINTIDAKEVSIDSVVAIGLSGAYYFNFLLKQFEYIESTMFDTPILLDEYWDQIYALNEEVQYEQNISDRVYTRRERVIAFFEYMKSIEDNGIRTTPLALYSITNEIQLPLERKLRMIVMNAKDHYGY